MTRYLFYNAHGPKIGPDPVGDLTRSKDGDTVIVPIDWSPASEANRDAILKHLGLSGISSLPCVVWLEPAHDRPVVDDNGNPVIGKDGKPVMERVAERWIEHRFVEQPQRDWTWGKIDTDIAAREAALVVSDGALGR